MQPCCNSSRSSNCPRKQSRAQTQTTPVRVPELERAGASEHTRALVSDLFRGSRLRLSGTSLLTRTSRGTRPDDPAADIPFAFTLTASVRQAVCALRVAGLPADLPMASQRHKAVDYQGLVSLDCPSWADSFFLPTDILV